MRLLILLLLLTSVSGYTQTNKYFIQLTDKNNSTFSISNPIQFLSQRAIDRRVRQNIAITQEDLPVNQSYVDSIVAKGAIVLTRSKWFNGITIQCDSSTLNSVLTLPFVASDRRVFRIGNPRGPRKFSGGMPLNTPSSLRISGINYGTSFNQIHLMNGEFLHQEGYTGEGMLIAVLDAGFYSVDQLAAFDSLKMNNRLIATWDFVDDEDSVFEDSPHGMNVLSTIAGNLPGALVGTAPGASFLLLRSEDASTENIIEEYNWNAAAEFADSAGADVITSSLGYTTFDDSTANHSYADMDGMHCPSSIAADIAVSKGILVVTSAGNSGSGSWHYIGAPSDGTQVISVGAVDSVGVHASFSSFGPGAGGLVKPNVCAKGLLSSVADVFGGVSEANGTSFACPILAGSATCLWQAFPHATALELKSVIERSAHLYHNPNDSMGYGIPDFRIADYFLSSGSIQLPSDDRLISAYPNPFDDIINLRIYSSRSQRVIIDMFNTVGQQVSSLTENVSGGSIASFELRGGNLRSGIYFIRILTESSQMMVTTVKSGL